MLNPYSLNGVATTKRYKCNAKTEHRQNVPKDKTSQGQNVPKDKTSQVQNVPRDKMSQGTKRPTPISVITKFSKTHFVLENWPYMYGNGPHSCSQFMIGVLLVWGG